MCYLHLKISYNLHILHYLWPDALMKSHFPLSKSNPMQRQLTVKTQIKYQSKIIKHFEVYLHPKKL